MPRHRSRLSISVLMAAVFACGLGLAALRDANEIWAGAITLMTFAVVGIAALGAIHQTGAARAPWLGFLVFAGGYLILGLGPWFSEAIAPTLPTTQLLDYIHTRVSSSPVLRSTEAKELLRLRKAAELELASLARRVRNGNDPAALLIQRKIAYIDREIAAIQGFALPAAAAGNSPTASPNRWKAMVPGAANHSAFLHVGQCLFAIIAGLCGAFISSYFHAKRVDDSTRQLAPPAIPGEH
jgi:hypothetical protein